MTCATVLNLLMKRLIWFCPQLFHKYMNFTQVIALQHYTNYMFNVESRRSQVNCSMNNLSVKEMVFYWIYNLYTVMINTDTCFLSHRCCCGRPVKCLRSWRTSRDSSTKRSTLLGPIYSVSDTQWACWTWPKRRLVLQKRASEWESDSIGGCTTLMMVCFVLPVGILWWMASETGRRGTL